MNIKEAIEILTAFQAVAGEDTTVNVESFQLGSGLHIQYEKGYGYSQEKEKSRTVTYSVDAVLPRQEPAQQQYTPNTMDFGRLTG